MYAAKVIGRGFDRLNYAPPVTTMVVTMPRFIIAQFNTHRVFSRNSASSRAIPTRRLIQRVLDYPYIPIKWGQNQAGMQSGEELPEGVQASCVDEWLELRNSAVATAERLMSMGVHKEHVNRCLEPWMWTTVIVTATEWDGFFEQRLSPHAQPEMRKVAQLMHDAMYPADEAWYLEPVLSAWHVPRGGTVLNHTFHDKDVLDELLVEVARAARVSYTKHAVEFSKEDDLNLVKKLRDGGHWSPFEHVAMPCHQAQGNLRGWVQLRAYFDKDHRDHHLTRGWSKYAWNEWR